jgi:hypothetical protein
MGTKVACWKKKERKKERRKKKKKSLLNKLSQLTNVLTCDKQQIVLLGKSV